MSKFGELLGGTPAPVATPPAPAPEPVVEAPPAPPEPAPVVIDAPPPVAAAPLKQQLFKKSKDELEQIGRGVGIELDKRNSHSKLVVELQSELEKQGKVQID
jgi:predicted component of type VI protein secretion system